MRIYTCAPTPPVPRPAWASAAGSRATTPPGPIRHSAIGRPMRSTNHRRSRGLLRHRSVWQHDRHYSPQGDRPELRSLSRLSKLGGPAQSGVVHEFEEGEIVGQLLLRDAAVRPQPGAQQRPNTFHGVDVDFAESILVSGILAPTMVNGLVAETPLRQSVIDRVLVGVDQAAERAASQEQSFDRGRPNIGQQMKDYGAAALNHAENRRFLLLQRAAARHPFKPRRRPARLFSPPPPADLCG